MAFDLIEEFIMSYNDDPSKYENVKNNFNEILLEYEPKDILHMAVQIEEDQYDIWMIGGGKLGVTYDGIVYLGRECK